MSLSSDNMKYHNDQLMTDWLTRWASLIIMEYIMLLVTVISVYNIALTSTTNTRRDLSLAGKRVQSPIL